MSKRYYKPQQKPLLASNQDGSLPTDRAVAVYYRQSSDAQIGNVSTSIQTIDMVEYLKSKGWAEPDIVMIDMDAGISGMKKIDERPGMKLLFELISEAEVGAVACQDEDRLFRDVTQIQVNIFIEACRSSRVLVITPSMLYDFANEQTGVFHARQFRFKCEMAAEYINSVIRGKLHRARERIMMEGRWAGTIMPPGFMVDMRKNLQDGSQNDKWRKFVPFAAFSQVVEEYYRLFLSYSGNLLATYKHILEHGPFYPDPESCQLPDGFKVYYRIQRHGNGFCPGRTALARLLSNAMYAGHWVVRDSVVRFDNHPAIVPKDQFLRAFNYLSSVTLDGQPNSDYRPFREQARPTLESERSVERPLAAGMIFGRVNNEWRTVGTSWIKQREHYVYLLATRDPYEQQHWIKASSFVDEKLVTFFRKKLQTTFDANAWEETLATLDQDYEKERKRILVQLVALERVLENQIASLDNLTNPDMIRGVQERYEDAKTERDRLRADLASVDHEMSHLEGVNALRETCGPALENWENLTRNEKRVLLHAFIERIEAEQEDGRVLKFVVHWRDDSEDTFALPKQTHNGWREWLPDEESMLTALVKDGATQIEVARSFSHRTWRMIKYKINDLFGTGNVVYSPHPINMDETYDMYAKRADDQPYHAHSGDHWTADDEERLIALVENGASQVELAEAFPHRKWGRIRAEVTGLLGKGIPIKGVGEVKRDETFELYQQRIGVTSQGNRTGPTSDAGSSIAARMPSC